MKHQTDTLPPKKLDVLLVGTINTFDLYLTYEVVDFFHMDDVMDWLIQFNAQTGVLDLLQSAWPQLLQGGYEEDKILLEKM